MCNDNLSFRRVENEQKKEIIKMIAIFIFLYNYIVIDFV